MSKKGIIFLVFIAIAAIVSYETFTNWNAPKAEREPQDTANGLTEKIVNDDGSQEQREIERDETQNAGRPKITVSDLHSDILRLIASGQNKVYNISPEEAVKELENRGGEKVQADLNPIDIKYLPFDILRAIAKSPASVANIKPQAAKKEIIRRYLVFDGIDLDGVNSTILLEALQRRQENKAIEDWADNEDAEAVDEFLKEEADNDESSAANFAYGLRRLDKEPKTAATYMERYAAHPHGDAFDNPDEEAANKELIEAIEKLK
ncbi:MAG: hypothetical protein LBM19_03130 [Holosporales bacterium]|jgi:hypothetical protein|nr:hypothetical protein [Holosporales bacterium]